MTLRIELPILLVVFTMLSGAACDKAANSTANLSKASTPANVVPKPTEPETKQPSPAPAGKEIKPADGPALKSITPTEGTVLGGVLNDLATGLPAPDPEAVKEAKETGKVTVEVVVNEKGEVSTSSVVNGPTSLWKAAGAAARQAKFAPPLKDGKPVKVAGVLIYEIK